MASQTVLQIKSDVLKWSVDDRYCIEPWILEDIGGLTYAFGDILEPGTTAATQKQQLLVAATADSVCLADADAVAADVADQPVLIRGPAIIDTGSLDYFSEVVATTNTALKDELILVRSGPTFA